MADRSIQFELRAYPADESGRFTTDRPQVEVQHYRNEAAARGHAGRWSKRVNGPVDLAHAGDEPWSERYLTTASPSEFHASGYRFERID
jgi:hypothetical protein